MAIARLPVSNAQTDKILSYERSQFIELETVDVSAARLSKHIAAFANTDGGEIYVGVDEDATTGVRTWRGFASIEVANQFVEGLATLYPSGQYFSYALIECAGLHGSLLQIDVRKTIDVKTASDGASYVRRGPHSLQIDSDEKLARLRLDKGITSFEASAIDVEPEVIVASESLKNFLLDVVPTAEPEQWLRKQRLLIEGKPSVAGVILFADEPQAILSKHCSVKLYRYRTTNTVGTRESLAATPATIEGHLYAQIYQTVAQTKRLIEGIQKLGPKGLENVSYPDETLHEIITNALLHRDYSIADDVHVRVFDNRVEVESPGRLPGHITIDNILEERFARNGTLVRLINKFPDPPNKDVGEGLNTAFSAMTHLRLRAPEIVQRPNSVIVYIRHEPLASPESIIVEYLATHPGAVINNRKVRELCFIREDWVVRRVLRGLEERGLIERIPGTRTASTAYRKV